jgi:hypothetical protein
VIPTQAVPLMSLQTEYVEQTGRRLHPFPDVERWLIESEMIGSYCSCGENCENDQEIRNRFCGLSWYADRGKAGGSNRG